MAPRKKKARQEAQRDPPPPPTELTVTLKPHPILPPSSAAASRTEQAKRRAATLVAKPLFRDRIWAVRDFLSPSECRAWISFAERTGLERTFHEATAAYAYRCNDRTELHDAQIANAIWTRLSRLVPASVGPRVGRGGVLAPAGCHPKIRLYRYERGHRFGRHVDESEVLDNPAGSPAGTRWMTGATVLIYLNGDGGDDSTHSTDNAEHGGAQTGQAPDVALCGGETAFYDGPRDEREVLRFKPRRGSLLLHGHGNLCLTHEACAVQSGTKYVLRTDVTYALN